MSIKENDRARVVGDIFDGKVGTVKSVYNSLGVAIVTFDEGIAKVPLSCLVKEKEPESEIPEGAKRITKAEFMAALQKITSPEAIFSGKSVDPIHALTDGLSAIIFGHKVASIIFEDKDVAVLTEDDLVGALWDACDPAVMSEEVNRKQSAFNCLLMSVSAVIVLRDLVTILFGEPEEGK